MKISWGTGIVLAFMGFMGFILYFVVLASTSERANHDLVTDRYYEQELGFQNEIDAERNAYELGERIGIQNTKEGIVLYFPERLAQEVVNGSIYMYRPSNVKLDFEMPLLPVDSEMLIPAERLAEGRWLLSIRWEANGREYLQKETITYLPNNNGRSTK